MTKHSAATYLLTLAFVVSSCDSHEGGIASKQPTTSIEELSPDVRKFFKAICARLEECNGDARRYASEEGCLGDYALRYGCDPGLASAEIPKLESCIDGLASLSCSAFLANTYDPSVCRDAFQALDLALGHSAEGEVCGGDKSCVAGTTCLSGKNESCGICQADRVEGDACKDECVYLLCNAAGKCQPYGGEGDPCGGDLDCAERHCFDGKCIVSKPGDFCFNGGSCTGDLDCVAGKCVVHAKLGQPCEQLKPASASCTAEAECIGGRCEAVGTCGKGELDTRCWGDEQCGAGLLCDDGRCAKALAEGARCDEAHDHLCGAGRGCWIDEGSDFNGRCRKISVPKPAVCE